MATAPKSKAGLTVVLPTGLIKGVKSRNSPGQTTEPGQVIQNKTLYNLLNVSARDYRSATNMTELIRHLSRAEGPISAATHNIVQVANCKHMVTAFEASTHQFSPEGTLLAMSIFAAMSTLYDFTEGFSAKKSEESMKAHMLREVVVSGGLAGELVLNEARVPDRIQVVPIETIEMVAGQKGRVYPQQKIAGENNPVKLDLPTFFMSLMQHDANSVYGFSMMDSSIKLIIYFEEFMEDIRRSVRQNGHTRTKVTLDTEKIMKTCPPSIRNDKDKVRAWLEATRDGVEAQLRSLTPEQALVMFDMCDAESMEAGLGNVDYTPLLATVAGMYATSMKTPPSAIGLRIEGGSQALGNVESLIFIKTCQAVQTPVEEVLSRALTLGCRLYGADVYIEFEFDGIDLRPETELEAFMTMRQARILERLSLGLISDDYAAHLLGTFPRPAGAPNLSGTMFHQKSAAAQGTTEAGSAQEKNTKPGDTAMGRNLQPKKDAPRKAGGKSQ